MQEKGLAAVRPWFGSLGEKPDTLIYINNIIFATLILLTISAMCIEIVGLK